MGKIDLQMGTDLADTLTVGPCRYLDNRIQEIRPMDAYIYQEALLCSDCAQKILQDREQDDAENGDDYSTDPCNNSDCCPQGPRTDGGGKSDCPEHCDLCYQFLKNPLTGDGERYVRSVIDEESLGDYLTQISIEWRDCYSYLFRS